MSDTNSEPGESQNERRMTRAELLGRHTHETIQGICVHIWLRARKYLVRGRFDGSAFGETLGSDTTIAAHRLRHLLVEIENGSYVPASKRRKRALARGATPRLSIRELCDNYLHEIRRTKGSKTVKDYRNRLTPVIAFSELTASRRKWPFAMSMDREFVIELRSYVAHVMVGRNGRPSSRQVPISPRQVYNVMDCARSMINWATRPQINQLPAAFLNPFTADLVGQRTQKDPLRRQLLPMQTRVDIVSLMDEWQLLHLAFAMLLPLRPEDFCGLLISEVDFAEQILHFRTRFGGRDFNKGRQSFVVPFPAEVAGLLKLCAGARADGPLLRKRSVFEGLRTAKLQINSSDELKQQLELALTADLKSIQTPQDQKLVVRRMLREMGGVSEDDLGGEIKDLFQRLNIKNVRPYDLRASISTDVNASGVSHLVQRYITGHTTRDIMNEYVNIDLRTEMQKYFRYIDPLITAICERSNSLGLRA
jgi:integrase